MNSDNKMSDKIVKQVTLQAPRSRVWQALTDSKEFSAWFGVALDGPFVKGQAVKGVFSEKDLPPKQAIEQMERSLGLAPAPIKLPAPDTTFCVVEQLEPERLFSFRWVPYGIDASINPKDEPTTLVEFVLDDDRGATRLTITESGFDRVPQHRRERAFRMNEHGWAAQAENIAKHVQSR
jgi:uncharacterized protein YndB with AHSA1/START domain